MTNNFEKMMETMLEQMMAKQMEKMMSKMLGLDEPQVAAAETVDPIKDAYKPKKMSRAEFLAFAETQPTPKGVDLSELDVVAYGNPETTTRAMLNMAVPSDIWRINNLKIKTMWEGKPSKSKDGTWTWKFDNRAKFLNFMANYQVVTELTETDKINLANDKKEQMRKKAEYYAKKAK